MLNQPEYLDLIVRYLNNPQDEELRAAIKTLRAESSGNESYFQEVEKIWALSAKSSSLEGVDEVKATKRFKDALLVISRKPFSLIKWLGAVAATIVVVGISIWIYNKNQSSSLLTKHTSKNQIDSVLLTDGTKIILAENSLITFPKSFDADERKVTLNSGTAFFRVAKDSKHPFSVTIGESKVKVLGTSFNINYLPGKIDLDVKTGRVVFSPYLNGASSILIAGQALTYNIQKREFTTRESQNADSWLTKELVFVDTPLDDVCSQLSDYYKVEIRLNNRQSLVKKLNANFNNNSLSEVLEVLKETYGLKIKETKDTIILKTP